MGQILMPPPRSIACLSNRAASGIGLVGNHLTPPRCFFHTNIRPSHHPHRHHVQPLPQSQRSRLTTQRSRCENGILTTSRLALGARFFSHRSNLRRPHDSSSRGSSHPKAPRSTAKLLSAVAVCTSIAVYISLKPDAPLLNEETFVPYTITGREQVSPTAFVLTVQPPASLPDSSSGGWAWAGFLYDRLVRSPTREAGRGLLQLRDVWARGATWSVEIKQPMLQVARDYTPLPPPPANSDTHISSGADSKPELRFLIRKMDRGEVSTYLSGLRVGDEVELRGPHYGFDAPRRLGDAKRVVFLAGGTGIAPALQVARAVLGAADAEGKADGGPKMDIIWANRHRADCPTCPDLRSVMGELKGGGDRGMILEQLAELQERFPGRLSVRCTVDDERTFVDANALAGQLVSAKAKRSPGKEVTDCWLHSQEALAWRPAADVDTAGNEGTDALPQKDCRCATGKNLLFVSGPEGFVEHFSGPKRWANGMELQGPVGGVLGKLRARYPDAMKDWLVLKL